jgi:hypothetical protein
MKKLVRSRPTWPGLGHQHHRQPDGDVEVPGQLEHRPVGLGVIQRLQLSRCPPLLWRQITERLLHPAKFNLKGPHRILI